jgi:transcriptional regulator with XRE-family HTH domain
MAKADEIGKRVRRVREQRGLSQQALADAADLQQTHVARLERGRHDPSLRVLRKIALALDVDLGALVTDSPDAPA